MRGCIPLNGLRFARWRRCWVLPRKRSASGFGEPRRPFRDHKLRRAPGHTRLRSHTPVGSSQSDRRVSGTITVQNATHGLPGCKRIMPGQRVRPYFGHPQVPVEDQRHRVNLELLPEPPPRSSAQSRATSAALSSPSRWYTVQRRQPRSPVTPSWAAAAGMRCSSGWPAARTWIRVVERAASAPSGSGWVDQRQPATANCPRTVTQPATHRPGRCRDRSAEHGGFWLGQCGDLGSLHSGLTASKRNDRGPAWCHEVL